MENHRDEYSALLQSRVMEGILGELDFSVRSAALRQGGDDTWGDAQEEEAHFGTVRRHFPAGSAGGSAGTGRPGPSSFAPGLVSYNDTRMLHYLLQELVKTVLRLEDRKGGVVVGDFQDDPLGRRKENSRGAGENSRRDKGLDLDLYTYLLKGSVWQCWKRLHTIGKPQIRSTLLKGVPKLNKLRQIAFSTLLHALCDTRALPLYRILS